jgi:hypothetical protein
MKNSGKRSSTLIFADIFGD